ncbi:hypothetical protein J6590_053858 [Homalodisca vitripennis]|nr:hypothetical protein J6590_053858 [Homalodisca vitripennis]
MRARIDFALNATVRGVCYSSVAGLCHITWQFGSIAQRRKRIYAYVTASPRAGQLLCSSSYPVEAVRIVDRLSSIDFNCNERDSTLIAKLRFNALPVVPNQSTGFGKKTQPPPPANKNKSPVKDVKNTSSGESKQSEVKSESEKVVVPSMFKNNPAPKKKAGEKAAAVNNKPSKGIGAFFSKTSKPINEQKPVVDQEKNNKEKKRFITLPVIWY